LIFGVKTTVLVTELLEDIVVEHAKETAAAAEVVALVNAPEAIAVTVISVEPAVVKPVAVNVPVPAVLTVIVAVKFD